MNEDQIVYVLNQLRSGADKTTIKNTLLDSGYKEDAVESLFLEAEKRMQATPVPEASEAIPSLSTPYAASTSFPILPIMGAIAAVVVIGGLVVAFYSGSLSFLGGPPYEKGNVLEGIQKGMAQVKSASYTSTLVAKAVPKDDDTYLFPEELADGFDPGIADLFSILPTDFEFELGVGGNVDTDNLDTLDTYLQIIANYITEDFSMNADIELVFAKKEGAFVRINRMPSLFFVDVSSIKGDWIHVIEEPLDDFFTESFDEEVMSNENAVLQGQIISELANKHEVFTVVGNPVKEEVNEETAYKYTLALNQPALLPFLTEAAERVELEFGSDTIFWLDELIAGDINLFTSSAFVDYLNTHMKVVIWADSDGIPVQFGVEGRIAVDEDAASSFLSVGDDAIKQSVLNNLRAQAELHYDDNNFYLENGNGYDGFCSSTYVLDLYDPYYYDGWEVHCNDNVGAYAADVILEDSSYCVDSTGYAGTGSLQSVSATSCSPEVSDMVTEKGPKIAERQVNVSLLVSLSDINEAVSVDIPSEYISLEEASKKMPMLELFVEGFNEGYTDAQNSGADAALKATVNNLRVEAELYYDNNGNSYFGFCNALAGGAYEQASDMILYNYYECSDDLQSYAMQVDLSAGTYCADSTGAAGETYYSLLLGTICDFSDGPGSGYYDEEYYYLDLYAPVGGEYLCIGDTMFIEWDSYNVENLTVSIYQDSVYEPYYYSLGAYPGTYNEAQVYGYGYMPWIIGSTKDGYTLEPGSGYHIDIRDADNQSMYTTSNGFTLQDCRG